MPAPVEPGPRGHRGAHAAHQHPDVHRLYVGTDRSGPPGAFDQLSGDRDQFVQLGNLALLLLAVTQFVIVIDASIVNVALPSIGAHLHFARTDLSWVVNAYTLTFGGFLLLGGRLADLLGRRRMFMLGLVLFSIASFAGGIAQSEDG